jgi:phage terminase large subunit-like protein
MYIEVPRGNGKSALSSPVGLYMMTADNEMGAEVYSAATSRDQAKIVFDVAKMMANMAPDFKQQIGVGCFAHHMEHKDSGSFFKPLSTEGNHLDGLNIHAGIVDELHAHKNREVYDVLVTGIGKRLQSMLWMITTAGFDTGGVCYEERTYMESVLLREVDDDSVFGIMYTLDEWDDWTQPASWEKANPCWGTAVRPEIVEQLAKKAMTIPSFQNNFRTKHLNQWMNADSVWMDMVKWDNASNPHVKMDQMQGMFTECFVGIDLASKKDLAAVSYLFTLDDESCEILKVPFGNKYILFTQFYLPQEAAEQGENSQYLGWVHDGYIKATPGNVTDFATIEEDVIKNCKKFEIEEVAFDPWQSTQMAQNMQKHGLEPIEYRNTVATMSEPMKAFDALIISDKMVHEGNPCMRWNVANTVCHFDAKDNIFPRKTRVENKIDGVVATIMALGRATLHDEDTGSAYDDWEEE